MHVLVLKWQLNSICSLGRKLKEVILRGNDCKIEIEVEKVKLELYESQIEKLSENLKEREEKLQQVKQHSFTIQQIMKGFMVNEIL